MIIIIIFLFISIAFQECHVGVGVAIIGSMIYTTLFMLPRMNYATLQCKVAWESWDVVADGAIQMLNLYSLKKCVSFIIILRTFNR